MKPTAPLALALCLNLPLVALSQQTLAKLARFTDPANLAGERVTPLNGHELPIDKGALGLAELLRKLNTRASILNIVAHPDDEDGGMLTLYARGLGARVTDLSLTRGEGGQNFVTGDFEDALGLIRTQELLANDRYTGVTQLFGTEVDFGFSKTREEAFQKWTHERVLYDAVRAIRIIRPLVITATFIGNVTDGHGQHQVSGEIAQEAFKAAADPNVFPELTAEGILPWQALKVYARVPFASIDSKGVYDYATNEYVPARFTNYVTGAVTTTKPPANITVPEGDTDPLLTAAAANASDIPATLAAAPTTPLSYMQFARIGLSLQRSQISRNMTLPTSGAHNSGYTLYGSVLCNAPTNARDPNITYSPTSAATSTSQTCHPEQAQRAAGPTTKLEPTLSANGAPHTSLGRTELPIGRSALDGASSPGEDSPVKVQGLKARLIAVSYATPQPTTNPAPSKTSVILSGADRAFASSAVEGPRTSPVPTLLLTNFHPTSPAPAENLSSRPERSEVERPLYLTAAYTPTNSSAQPASGSGTNRYPEAGSPMLQRGVSSGLTSSGTNRYPEPSGSGLIATEETGVLTPGYAPTDLTSQPTFFTGIDTSIEAIATLAPNAPPTLRTQLATIATNIAKATQDFNPNNPSAIAPPIAEALKTDDTLIGQLAQSPLDPIQKENVLHELRIKRVQLNDALTLALGLHLDATATSSDVVENSTPEAETHLAEDSQVPVSYEKVDICADACGNGQSFFDSVKPQISSSHPLDHDWQILSQNTQTITQPYFYRDNIEQPVYKLRDPSLRSAPQTPAPLTAWATVTYQGTDITLARIVHAGPQPISIIPPVSIASAPSNTVLPHVQRNAQLIATLTTEDHTSANINVQSPKGWAIQAKAIPAPPNDPTHAIAFYPRPLAPFTDPAIFRLSATTPDHHTYTEGWRAVGYPGLILTNDYTPATTRVVPVDLKLPDHDRIAYLPGTGDAVPQALTSIGLTPTLVTVAGLTLSNLANYDTVVLGVRAYTAHPDLQGAPTKALLAFARNGGNVVVQYQTSDFTSADAPYPLDLGPGAKVVVETDPVQLLDPATHRYADSAPGMIDHSSPGAATNRYPEPSGSGLIATEGKGVSTPGYALLNVPNKITTADFNNWIEERGHGFLETWDPHYTALTETHDPGGDGTLPQPPQRGGLITAQVGKGRWTYVAFALYRQLPQAVPGAFRIFVNLVTPPTR
ncbi:MAG: PIG-L family deacetylase [Acidobacteriaceae bacterium]